MTEELDLDALELLIERTTPGPWIPGTLPDDDPDSIVSATSTKTWYDTDGEAIVSHATVFEARHTNEMNDSDRAFVMAARTALPLLIERVRYHDSVMEQVGPLIEQTRQNVLFLMEHAGLVAPEDVAKRERDRGLFEGRVVEWPADQATFMEFVREIADEPTKTKIEAILCVGCGHSGHEHLGGYVAGTLAPSACRVVSCPCTRFVPAPAVERSDGVEPEVEQDGKCSVCGGRDFTVVDVGEIGPVAKLRCDTCSAVLPIPEGNDAMGGWKR